jgi:hypothetical protein
MPGAIYVLSLIVLFFVTTPAQAAVVLFDTSVNPLRSGLENQGWWPPTLGYSNFEESDYHFTGWTGVYPDTETRSFFSYYLDPVYFAGQTITGATFIARKGISSGDTTQEILSLFDVATPTALVAHNVTTNYAIWTDLGTGTLYGSLTFNVGGNPDENLLIPLNAAALTDIASSIGGYFTVGAALTSGPGYVFGLSGAEGTQALALELSPLPEPIALTLMALGLTGLAMRRARRAKPQRGVVARDSVRSRSALWRHVLAKAVQGTHGHLLGLLIVWQRHVACTRTPWPMDTAWRSARPIPLLWNFDGRKRLR